MWVACCGKAPVHGRHTESPLDKQGGWSPQAAAAAVLSAQPPAPQFSSDYGETAVHAQPELVSRKHADGQNQMAPAFVVWPAQHCDDQMTISLNLAFWCK